MKPGSLLITHAITPLAAFAVLFTMLAATDVDVAISNHFFDFAVGVWPQASAWWSDTLIHSGGRVLVMGYVLSVLSLLLLATFRAASRPWARPAGYLLSSIALILMTTGAMKHLSNVPCPFQVDLYGGNWPFVPFFATRSYVLDGVGCFPGGHSGGGFSFIAVYFALRERYPGAALAALAGGLAIGSLFAFGQLVRGQHFVSHDLASAAIAWGIALGAYMIAFRGRLWSTPGGHEAPASGDAGVLPPGAGWALSGHF